MTQPRDEQGRFTNQDFGEAMFGFLTKPNEKDRALVDAIGEAYLKRQRQEEEEFNRWLEQEYGDFK